MLQQIELRFFKCFALLKLPLSPLTLLSGANASGKSSVMQALALLHQTIRDHEWSKRLMLNGTSVRLGTAAAVIDDVYGRRTCGIALQDGAATYEWDFAGERDEMSMVVERVRVRGSGEERPQALRHLLPVAFDEPQRADPLASRCASLLISPPSGWGHASTMRWRTLSSRLSSAPPESTPRACCTPAGIRLFWIPWRFRTHRRRGSVRSERAWHSSFRAAP